MTDKYWFDHIMNDGIKPCNHWEEPVKIGDYTVHASGLMNRQTPRTIKLQGVYLAQSWDMAYSLSPKARTVKWVDNKAIPLDYLVDLVNWAVDRLTEEKTLEVGCMGGHGRTGTLLACLIVKLEGKTAREAIESLWDRYCIHAVESISQMKLVYRYERYLKAAAIYRATLDKSP